jgi:hypothetical protein
MLRFIVVLSFLCIYLPSNAQSDSLDVYLERWIESNAENFDEESFDLAATIEVLEQYKVNPLNLNNITEEQLSVFFFLSPTQKHEIINHPLTHGDYITVEELQTLSTLDDELIKVISRYFTVDADVKNKFAFSQLKNGGKSELYIKTKRTLQDKKGYIPNDQGTTAYPGSPQHYMLRYKFLANNNFKAGFTAEKDPGEHFFSGNNKYGFDFYSAYVQIKNFSKTIQSIIVGDYTMSMGQGLILHNDYGSGKSAFAVDIKKSSISTKPYSSVAESNFFRGLSIETRLSKNVDIVAGYSYKYMDASSFVDTLENENFETAGAISRTGLHRTSGEINNQYSLSQQNIAAKLKYHFANGAIGLNHLSYTFSKPINKSEEIYNLYRFDKKNLSNTSIDYSYRLKNINFFGEAAISNNGGLAHIHSAILSLHKKVDMSLSIRRFGVDYQVLEANAFSEGTLPINENATYLGMELRPNNQWKISTYVDYWTHPWFKFNVDAPSEGKELLTRIEYTIKRKFNAYIQYKVEQKYLNNTSENLPLDRIASIITHKARFHLSHKATKEIELRSRAEFSMYADQNHNLSNGTLLYQDIIYKPIAKPFSFTARYAIFDIDQFANRIYAYENDILYEFAIPAYLNKGSKFYINSRFKLPHDITAELRYALTKYDDIKTIGSGNELIDGSIKSEIKAQLKFEF